ncbi:unnamed protein product [Meganyctiphanes norvegica]|uniref:Uncharacterized protein n=1 Tax=Meganyctiphanes norvegica TaxID=48144 RepID=A0AAV2R3J5_MEGNR
MLKDYDIVTVGSLYEAGHSNRKISDITSIPLLAVRRWMGGGCTDGGFGLVGPPIRGALMGPIKLANGPYIFSGGRWMDRRGARGSILSCWQTSLCSPSIGLSSGTSYISGSVHGGWQLPHC